MRRSTLPPRPDWQRRCEEQGFSFHSVGGRYWQETACYVFTAGEIDVLEAAAEELHRLCLKACEHVVRDARYAELAVPADFFGSVGESWKRRDPTVFGRFDIAWDGSGPPKLLEYNADTPTALIEASVAQWFWLEDRKALRSTAAGAIDGSADQFNSLHEKLIERWKDPADGATIHFSCVRDHEEDLGNTSYLRDTAIQASRATRFIFMEDIGWSAEAGCFVDLEGNAIEALFKLYPGNGSRARNSGRTSSSASAHGSSRPGRCCFRTRRCSRSSGSSSPGIRISSLASSTPRRSRERTT